MVDLDSLIVRLETLFLDPHGLALPQGLGEEAFRTSLEELNTTLGSDYLLSGLQDASLTTLPDGCLSALLQGAAAVVLEAVLMHNQLSYSNLPANQPDIESWARYLRQERDRALDRLRLRAFSQSDALPWATWNLEDPSGYD